MKKLVAFDYDGVIVDSLKVNRQITNDACRELVKGVREITQDDIENLNHMSFQEVAKVIGVPSELIPECLKLINERLVASYSQLSLFDGITNLVKQLSEDGYLVAIVTHNTEAAVHSLMRNSGIDQFFCAVLGAETDGEKGDKLKLLQERFEITAENTYMIGDSVGDIREAKLAGAKAIAVSWGFQSLKRLKTCDPDFIVETPKEIEDVLEG
jgi:phosphoglycolate phosphatase